MEITDKRIMVTGGAGFIGSHLVDALAEDNYVLVVDDFSAGSKENLKQHQSKDNVRIVEADIRDKQVIHSLARDIDIIYHLAAACLRISINKPEMVHEVNATGSLNTLEAALNNQVKRVVYVSSSEVYGSAKQKCMNEEHPLDPTTPYGASKLAGELYARAFHHTYHLPVIVVRPFNTYGPREYFTSVHGEVIPRFIARAANGLSPVIFGDGKQTRDFTYISDSVAGIISASKCDELIGDCVNVARGSEVSINEIAQIVLQEFEREDLKPEYHPPRPGDVRRHFADISKAKRTLGFSPKVDIRDGIGCYVEWLKAEHVDLKQALNGVPVQNW